MPELLEADVARVREPHTVCAGGRRRGGVVHVRAQGRGGREEVSAGGADGGSWAVVADGGEVNAPGGVMDDQGAVC